jgi:hypothetical protein
MQAFMWIVLCGAIGLAALVDSAVRRANAITMSSPIAIGPVNVELPADWRTNPALSGLGQEADEQGGMGRKLTVTVQHVSRIFSPVEYLDRTGQLPQSLDQVEFSPLSIAGFPGIYARWMGIRFDASGTRVPHGALCFCAVLPSYDAVTIRLDKPGAMQSSDLRVVQAVLASLQAPGQTAPAGNAIDLPGVHIAIPDDFLIYPQPDPLRTDRTIVRTTDDGGWVSAQFIPMLSVDDAWRGSIQEALEINERLDPRDPGQAGKWLNAGFTNENMARVKIDPGDTSDALVQRRAYLYPGQAGESLLVVLTAQAPAGDTELDAVIAELTDSIEIKGSADLSAMFKSAKAAEPATPAAIRKAGEEWWLWTRAGQPQGWSHYTPDSSGDTATRQNLRRGWSGIPTRILQRWGLGDTLAGFWTSIARFDGSDQPTFYTQTNIANGQIITQIKLFEQQNVESALPDGFITSAAFPRMLFSVGAPAAVWTDRFIGCEGQLLPWPILLRLQAVSGAPGKCVEAQINGTGELSRWYFHADGSLDHADFPGGWSVRVSTAAEIQSAVQGDDALTIPGP